MSNPLRSSTAFVSAVLIGSLSMASSAFAMTGLAQGYALSAQADTDRARTDQRSDTGTARQADATSDRRTTSKAKTKPKAKRKVKRKTKPKTDPSPAGTRHEAAKNIDART